MNEKFRAALDLSDYGKEDGGPKLAITETDLKHMCAWVSMMTATFSVEPKSEKIDYTDVVTEAELFGRDMGGLLFREMRGNLEGEALLRFEEELVEAADRLSAVARPDFKRDRI